MSTIRISKEAYSKLLEEHKRTRVAVSIIASDMIMKHYSKPTRTKTHPLHTKFIEAFCIHWERLNGFKYGMTQADVGAVKALIKKCEKLDEKNAGTLELFEIVLEKLPNWYKDKGLAIINSKFNDIIAEIKRTADSKAGRAASSEPGQAWDLDKVTPTF
jgi:hypothetical protein